MDYSSIKVFGNTDYSVDYSNNQSNNPLPNGALASASHCIVDSSFYAWRESL